jgi:hypothetical protein
VLKRAGVDELEMDRGLQLRDEGIKKLAVSWRGRGHVQTIE